MAQSWQWGSRIAVKKAGVNQECGCAFGKKGFPQVAQVHISPDGYVWKSLQQELINSIRILVIIY